ncbi:unnamed protein product, partial [Vitis vinifera]
MKNTIRCCISCILPCGALDVVRIVHSNGHVEEISGTITASEIMKAHPKHVLKKPSSSSEEGVVPKIVVVPPDAELQRGKIYFLMPIPPPPEKTRSRSGDVDGMRQLARAIERFGEIYEKVEAEKQKQMFELEKQRMQFAKDVEFQRMKMFMDTQVQLEKIKRAKRSGLNDSEAVNNFSLLYNSGGLTPWWLHKL